MSDNIGLKIGLEGEKEFKKSLSEINSAFKVLGSEMKLVSSEFDKNDKSVTAVTARNQVLNKEIELQKSKIDTLIYALANATQSFGEADKRTQNWQIQLNNAEAALNDMERELEENNSSLNEANQNFTKSENVLDKVENEMDDVTGSADDMEEGIDDAGDTAEKTESKFTSLGTALKAAGAAMGVVVTAAVKLGKGVVESYSQFEQLEGGIKTLFGTESGSVEEYAKSVGKNVKDVQKEYDSLVKAQSTVFTNANNAYKNAGLSANEYMETVTGFSASLIQSLGGDTVKAASYANTAVVAMADNANKMGTDMSSIQTAYQGFAKQNYTMLDNLKLGYGGTKEEMQRLISDASKMKDVQKELGLTVDGSSLSFDNIVSAIQVMQTSMGIAGATEAEAAKTIEGSINSLGSAFKNLVTGLGTDGADIDMLVKNIAEAFNNVVNNISPVVERLTEALPAAVSAALESLSSLSPALLGLVSGLFSSVLETLTTLLPTLLPVVLDTISAITTTVIEQLPTIVNTAAQLITTLINALTELLPTLIPVAIEAVTTIAMGLIDNLPKILDAALELVTAFAQGVIESLPVLIEALPEIIDSIVDFLIESLPTIVKTGVTLFTALIDELPNIITTISNPIRWVQPSRLYLSLLSLYGNSRNIPLF